MAATTTSLTAARHHGNVLREKAFAAIQTRSGFDIGREDALEARRCGHLHQRLVGDQWLIIVATALLATAPYCTTALALLAHLLAGYGTVWSGEGAADTVATGKFEHVLCRNLEFCFDPVVIFLFPIR